MNDLTIDELQQQNRRLRMLVLSLSATLLRKIAVKSEMIRSLDNANSERLLREAEECFKCARIPGLKSEFADGLQAAGSELMTKAVEIETEIQRAKREA